MKFYILFLLILNCQSESYSISLNTEYLRGYINFPELNAGETIKLEARILNQSQPGENDCRYFFQLPGSNFDNVVYIPMNSVDTATIEHRFQYQIVIRNVFQINTWSMQFFLSNFVLPTTGGIYNFLLVSRGCDQDASLEFPLTIVELSIPLTFQTYGKTFEINSLDITANLQAYSSKIDLKAGQIHNSRLKVPELLVQQVECKRDRNIRTYCHVDSNNQNDIIVEELVIQFPYQSENLQNANVNIKILNINNPPTIQPYNNYGFEFYNKNTNLMIATGSGILQVLEASQFDTFNIISTNSRGSQQTKLTISLLSRYYTVPNSILEIQFSEMPQIQQVNLIYLLKDSTYQIVDNKILIQILDRIDVPLLIVELIILNLKYQTSLQLTASIYHNNYLSLQSTQFYQILPSPYKQFSVSRISDIVSEVTTLQIQIVLNQELQSGQITIDLPSELGQTQKIESMLNGDTFTFSYEIQNSQNICQTSPFKSQSFTNGKIYEELVDIVTLTQTSSTLSIQSVIFANPTISTKTDIIINLDLEQIDLLIILDPIFPISIITCEFQGICTQTDSNAFKVSGAPIKSGIVLKNVMTPAQLDPISITFSTFDGKCLQKQGTHMQQFQPSTLSITPQISTLSLGLSAVWSFSFQILYDLNNNNILQFQIPKELSQSQQILCEFRQPVSVGAQCKDGIIDWTPQIASGSMIQIIVSGLFNPLQKINLQWTLKILNQKQQIQSQGTTSFNQWTESNLQYAEITLLNYKLNQTKEAILNIKLQFPITQIYFKSNTPIYCKECEIKPGYTLINYVTQDTLIQLPFRYIYEQAQVNYELETYSNNQLLESGVFQQVIQLYCDSKCLTCETSFNNCTSCIDGFYFEGDCVETCPQYYYGYEYKCLPCYISFCAKCAISQDAAEHCIECTQGKQLSRNNTCVSNITTQNTTLPNTDPPPIIHPLQQKFQYQITYQFPGTLIILTIMILLSLLSKFRNKYSVSETIFYVQLCLLEYSLGIVLLIYFLASHRFNIAFLSISLTIGQLIQQSQAIIHLNSQLSIDSDYQLYKKNWSVRLVHYITLCFTFQFQLMLTSKITKHKQWNYGWTMKESILRLLRQQMKTAPVYSIFQTSIVIASLLESQNIETFYLEVIGVNLISIVLNFKHQYKFYKLDQSIEI